MANAQERELLRSLLVLDPDELVDILGIESKDLLAKFPEKVREYLNDYQDTTYNDRRRDVLRSGFDDEADDN